MAVWLDIIGSFVFGSLLALNVMRLNADMAERSYKGLLGYGVQYQAAALAQVVEEDLRKMGYGVSGTAIVQADSAQLRFLADLEADGQVDTLHYYRGGTDEAAETSNPEDCVLYRAQSGQATQELRLGVTRFALSYFDAEGDSLALPVTLAEVRRIRLDLTVESAEPYDTTYAQAFIQLRVRPKNLGL
jgi:hypothetical protein